MFSFSLSQPATLDGSVSVPGPCPRAKPFYFLGLCWLALYYLRYKRTGLNSDSDMWRMEMIKSRKRQS